jgi:hypothetical protein
MTSNHEIPGSSPGVGSFFKILKTAAAILQQHHCLRSSAGQSIRLLFWQFLHKCTAFPAISPDISLSAISSGILPGSLKQTQNFHLGVAGSTPAEGAHSFFFFFEDCKDSSCHSSATSLPS